jgi:hypothetical protein
VVDAGTADLCANEDGYDPRSPTPLPKPRPRNIRWQMVTDIRSRPLGTTITNNLPLTIRTISSATAPLPIATDLPLPPRPRPHLAPQTQTRPRRIYTACSNKGLSMGNTAAPMELDEACRCCIITNTNSIHSISIKGTISRNMAHIRPMDLHSGITQHTLPEYCQTRHRASHPAGCKMGILA